MDVNQLADRIARKPSTVRRLEAEETEPSVEQINALVAALPISAEELLRLMGVSLTLPAAARLPKALVDELVALSPAQQQVILALVRELPKGPGRR
jgi:transcriptional regulator with XRE-family HTH domain